MVHNNLHDRLVVEPFAGGAGATLRLLFDEYASTIVINDFDRRISSFWKAVINQTSKLIGKIRATPVTMKTWHRCHAIYQAPSRHPQLEVAFATFFLNRCNRSGILYGGGPIGGYEQRGEWKIDVRYNVEALVSRIERIAEYRKRISVTRQDAGDLLANDLLAQNPAFVYLDPPYFEKGRRLYMNNMSFEEHAALARHLLSEPPFHWVMTYDNVKEIRQLYKSVSPRPFRLGYSAYARRTGREVLIIDPRLKAPQSLLDRHVSTRRIGFVKNETS